MLNLAAKRVSFGIARGAADPPSLLLALTAAK